MNRIAAMRRVCLQFVYKTIGLNANQLGGEDMIVHFNENCGKQYAVKINIELSPALFIFG